MQLRSATGQSFYTSGSAHMCLHTREGIDLAGSFQVAPDDTGLHKSIISVGEVTDKGSLVVFMGKRRLDHLREDRQ